MTTLLDGSAPGEDSDQPRPGLVMIFCQGQPACVPIPLGDRPIVLGREEGDGVVVVADHKVSRKHTKVALHGGGLRVTDLDSRNGTFVDGAPIRDESYTKLPRLLRLGQSVLLVVADVNPFLRHGVQAAGDSIVGPALREVRLRIESAAAAGDTLLLTGPSGSGKELAARAFHAAGNRGDRPFTAVNCAAIPDGLAERLLFGARRGAYSGAAEDADGYIQSADRGTLFLDEVAELELGLQAKLLRVVETREVLALGASKPRKVDIRLCAATLKDLRAEVAAGRFREDLYYRIGRPEERIPSLSERLEELPWLAARELARGHVELAPSTGLIEACALRPWPGNVRELLAELRQAGRAALESGRKIVSAKDLAPSAGQIIGAEAPRSIPTELSTEAVEAALRRDKGNVTRAAAALGLHRNQLRRWISRNNVDPKVFSEDKSAEDA